jgi:hypothetical protein
MFKIIAFFIITLFARLYARVGILLTYGKHLHDCIISVRGEVCAHKPGLTTPRFIEVPDLYQARKVDGHVYPTLAYNLANSVIIKNAIILNIIQNIFNLGDTEVVMSIILDLLNKIVYKVIV